MNKKFVYQVGNNKKVVKNIIFYKNNYADWIILWYIEWIWVKSATDGRAKMRLEDRDGNSE